MKIDLYLNNQLVEINKDIDFVLNKQFTNLTDLTSIIVDYSKTIKVPMTAKNNELFNYTYKLDRQVLLNNDIITYDPTQKIPMSMVFNGSTVMEGYAVLNSVNLKDKTYEINLYGELGKIFKDMKEKPLRKYKKESNGFWASKRMNTYNVAQSFLHDSEHRSTNWSSNDWYDFWGFAPQIIGKDDTIDTTSYEVYGGDVTKFADTVNATRSITYGETLIGDGLDVNQYCEFRTYMTRPYVYVDKLIKLVQNEINNSDYDGYTLTLSNDWFNDNNPYYRHLCFFPGNESVVDSGESTNGLVTWDNSERTMYFPQTYLPSTTTVELEGYTYTTSNSTVTIANSDAGSDSTATLTLNADNIYVRDRVTGVGSTTNFDTNGRWAFYNVNPTTIPIRYIGIYDANDNLIYKLYLCDDTLRTVIEHIAPLNYYHSVTTIKSVWERLSKLSPKIIVPNSYNWANSSSDHNYCEITQVFNFGNITIPTNAFKFKVQCDIINLSEGNCKLNDENISYSDYHSLCPFKNDKYRTRMWNDGATYSLYFRPIQTMNVTSNNYRSGSYWSVLDILGEDFVPFTWLIDYVKKFRLFFDIDYKTKTITLQSCYFNTVTYKDVIVDYSKEVIVEPIVNKYKYINYGYAENDGKKFKKYKKKYNCAYGDQDINTNVDINSETMSLIPDDEESVFIPTKLDTLSWNTLNSTGQLKYTNPLYTNKMINTLNVDGDIEYFQFYAFRLANLPNPQQSQVNFYWLSDDTPKQKNSGEYCYLDRTGWSTEVETTEGGNNVYYLLGLYIIPQFDNFYPTRHSSSPLDMTLDLWWNTFQVPKEVYNGYIPSNFNNYCVYNKRWENYLNEIFNQNNKKVTCYVRLSYPEFIDFKFNQLWVIDGNTFLVNKIVDFNPNSMEPTKVELIQISDVTNLK